MADDPSKAESLQQFLAITGATDVQAATHMLEGNAWDVEAAVNFFFSSGETGTGHGTSAGSTEANATQQRNSPVEAMEEDDRELQIALAASMSNASTDRPSSQHVSFQPPPFRPPAQPVPPHLLRGVQNVTDEEDDGLDHAMRLSAAQRRQDLESDAQVESVLQSSVGMTGRNQETDHDHSDGEDATEQAFIEAAIKASLEHPQPGLDGDDDPLLAEALHASLAKDEGEESKRSIPSIEERFPQLRAQELAQKRAHEAQFVPDTFSESRAAGIPENLRRFMDVDDDFGAPKYNPPSPSTMEARRVREEQDRAYEESLEMDRAKEMSKKEAQRAAQEAEELAKQEAMRLAKEKETKKAEMMKELSRKRALIPAEPNAGAEGVTTIGVRLQDGSRLPNRKFRSTDRIEVLYIWVETALLERQLEAGDEAPAKLFDLVSMAPVRAFKDRSMTLAEAELASQTLLSVQFRNA
uniref:UBX domain-containing protein n=1 Tax=Hanusia phi TaxID=3032 RepID=A0A7S0HVD8_9CRYP